MLTEDYHAGAATPRARRLTRLIGAICGAFFLGFSAAFTAYFLPQFGVDVATKLSVAGIVLGGVGGYLYPRVGHFLAYALTLILGFGLSLTIGRNANEQLLLFGIFALAELGFLASRRLLST